MIICLRLLCVPMSFILFTPHHSLRRPIHNHARPLYGSLHMDLTLPRWWIVFATRSTTSTVIRQLQAPTLRILLRALDLPFDGRQKVKVTVDAGRGGEITAPDVCGGVSGARALCPKLVTLRTGKGASLGRAARTAIFGGVGVTEGIRQRSDWDTTVTVVSATNQILHNSLNRSSDIA